MKINCKDLINNPFSLLAVPLIILFCCLFYHISWWVLGQVFHHQTSTTDGVITDFYSQENHVFNRTDYFVVYTYQVRNNEGIVETFIGHARVDELDYKRTMVINKLTTVTYRTQNPAISNADVAIEDNAAQLYCFIICLFPVAGISWKLFHYLMSHC